MGPRVAVSPFEHRRMRRDGGEFVDSSTRQSYLKMSRGSPKIPLEQNGTFLNVLASRQTGEMQSTATSNSG